MVVITRGFWLFGFYVPTSYIYLGCGSCCDGYYYNIRNIQENETIGNLLRLYYHERGNRG
jgi:hypothetical protein